MEEDYGILAMNLRQGYDCHVHWRDGDMMRLVAPMTARQFAGAVLMPNLSPPITTNEQLDHYRIAALQAVAKVNPNFLVLGTFYLTDQLDPQEVDSAVPENAIGVKYYPRGLTTNSESGVRDPASLWTEGTRPYQVLRILAQNRGVLMLHAANGVSSTGEELDPYDQEIHFVRETLPRIRDAHPHLKITFEHLSTAQGAEYMRKHGGRRLGCTVTAHHLLLDRRDTHRKGLHVHNHCWPIIQNKRHRNAVRQLVAEGLPFVFLGSDSAPHPIARKETACCAGGVFTAHCAMELYAEAFEAMGALNRLQNFSSVFGPRFYDLPLADDYITLTKEPWTVPERFLFTNRKRRLSAEEREVRPFRAGEQVHWKFEGDE